MSNSNHAPEPSAEQAKFIDDRGGPIKVARAIAYRLNIYMSGQRVSNWKRRGIPFWVRGTLVVLGQALDPVVNAPANFFGTDTQD